MSTHNKDQWHYANHRREVELEDGAAHAHLAAEQQHGKQDHLTGAEHSRLAQEHSAQDPPSLNGASVGHGIVPFGHEETAALAHRLWETRGRPEGSPDEDWFNAVKELRARAIGR